MTESDLAARVPPALQTAGAWLWRLLLVAGSIWLLGTVLVRLWPVVALIATALFLTALLKPPTDWLYAKGMPRLAATWVVTLTGLLVVSGVLGLILPRFVDELGSVQAEVGLATDAVQDWLVNGPLELDAGQVADLRGRLLAVIGIGRTAGGPALASMAVDGALVAAQVLGAAVLIMVLAFFFVKDGDDIVRWMVAQLDAHLQAPARRIGGAAWSTLAGYLRGVSILAGFNALATAVGLMVIGVPFVIALAVIEFLASFVPIVGALVSGALAAVVAFVTGGVTEALLVVALAIAIDQFEGHFFQPVVIGRAIKLHAIVVIVALTAGTLVAGIAGAIFSVPLTGMAVAAIGEFRTIRSQGRTCQAVPAAAK